MEAIESATVESNDAKTIDLTLNSVVESNNVNKGSLDESNETCCTKTFNRLRIEIAIILFMLSHVMTNTVSTNLILDKVCLVHLNYSDDICRNISQYSGIKDSVEKMANNYQIGQNLLKTAPAAALACFIGPWSDQYGRKFPLLIAVVGRTIDSLGSTICAYFLLSRVEYLYIPAIFAGVSGGVVTFVAVMYSYVPDLCPLKLRTIKFGLVAMAVGLSQAFGGAMGGWIFDLAGYPPVFMVSAVGMISSALFIALLLPETRGKDNKDSWNIKFNALFSCKTLKEGFYATIKARPDKGKKQILLLLASMACIVVATDSTGDIGYLFVHHQFDWTNSKFSNVNLIYTLIIIFMFAFIIPLLRCIKAGDPLLGLLGTTSLLAKCAIISIAYKEIVYHIANISGIFLGLPALAVRSRISKVVSKEDFGKIFSFLTIVEYLLPVVATVIISQIYNASLEFFPGMPYAILALLLLIPLCVFIWLSRLPTIDFKELINEEVQKNSSQDSI